MDDIVVYTAQTWEPVDLTTAKLHLKVDVTDDDALITSLIKAAREQAESYTWLKIPAATFDLYLDAFPAGNIEINTGPVTAISSVKYYDEDNALQTLDSSNYITELHGIPALIAPVESYSWPTTYVRPGAVVIRFTAGYAAAANVPAGIIQAMLLMIGHWYENRELVSIGHVVQEIPYACTWLLDSYRCYAH